MGPSPGDMKSLPRAMHAKKKRLGLSLKAGTVYKPQMFCLFIHLLTQSPIATALVLDCSLIQSMDSVAESRVFMGSA